MRIAMPTIWFHRGQTVVTQTLARALRELGHEVRIHARMGAVYGQGKQEKGRWGWHDQKIVYWPEYDLKKEFDLFLTSMQAQDIDLVLFNEEYDWELVGKIKTNGFKVATYLDYLHNDWVDPHSPLAIYDRILCSTHRSFLLAQGSVDGYGLTEVGKVRYIGWGIHPDCIIRQPTSRRPYLFFENVGWLGINDRKGLGTLLTCFQALIDKHPKLLGSLLVQCQVEIDAAKNAHLLRGVDVMSGSMNQPGLYHMAQVYCYPAILDGLGLSLLEAIASGCAVICPDATPWNEFVEHEKNGLLVPIESSRQREDGIAFPEVFVDKDAWISAMERLAMDGDLRLRLGGWGLSLHDERLGWKSFKTRIAEGLR